MAGLTYIYKSVSLHWLGAFKSEMMISNPIQCDRLMDTWTQPFIFKDVYKHPEMVSLWSIDLNVDM